MSEGTKARLSSRKLWVTGLVGAFIAFSKNFGIDLDAEQIYSLLGLSGTYCIGNGMAKGK